MTSFPQIYKEFFTTAAVTVIVIVIVTLTVAVQVHALLCLSFEGAVSNGLFKVSSFLIILFLFFYFWLFPLFYQVIPIT